MKVTVRSLVLMVVLLLLTAIPVWASQGVGSSPYAADLLVSGLNMGEIDPGEEYWYAYSRLDLGDAAYNSIILSLNFEAEGRAVASRVNFQVFSFEQVDAWLKDNSGPVDSLGLGTPATADFDVNTGERLWAGPMAPNEVYYVRIFNLSPSPVQFRLTALGQKNSQIEGFMDIAQTTPANESQVIPAAISVPSDSDSSTPEKESITAALPVQPEDDSPASTGWLLAAQAIQGLPPAEAAAWLMSAAALGWLPGSSGQASLLMPVDPSTGEIVGGNGGSGGDGGSGAGGDVAAVPVAPDPTLGHSIYPNQPLKLLDGPNTGLLAPKTEHWYTFTPGKVDGELIENLSLTMFFTPGEPNIARDVTFELFTGSQYQIWDRGTPDDMEHFGAGSWVSRDWDYNTGERLWHGTVVDGDQYFVKIINESGQWIDYHLLPGDIINTELGPPTEETKPIAPVDRKPTGKDIGSPLEISSGHTRGHLAAGEDVWFSFEYKTLDPDKFIFDHFIINFDHTPGAGYVTNYVNVEIYPFQDQQIWRRGDTDQIEPLGAGSDFKYNQTSDIHTWIWDGHLVSNTTYFIRLRNDSPRAIDYDLFIQHR